ncbi:peptidase [Mucilaginibacter sp.]|uniref:peptidase n=1 Tax=Mucilaginibacter sp. TaxID=1882438 RepID=UPI0032640A78
MPTFVLNDENVVNSYGFRVRNEGIDFKRFDANPVMLDSHINRTDKVMGKWVNRRIEGALLKMDTEFDKGLPAAVTLEGQVERGYVKGSSLGLGISFDENSFERQPDGNWDLIQSVCMEGTICGVPSNEGSLSLFDIATGLEIKEDQIKLSLQQLSAEKLNQNTTHMKEFKLSAPAMAVLVGFGLANAESEVEINNAIEKLNIALKAEATANANWQTKFDAQAKLQAEALVDGAIANEQILAGEREEWVGFAVSNFKLASSQIGKMPGKVSLSARVDNKTAADDKIKTVDDFEKLTTPQQLAFKSEKPEAYAALFAK